MCGANPYRVVEVEVAEDERQMGTIWVMELISPRCSRHLVLDNRRSCRIHESHLLLGSRVK